MTAAGEEVEPGTMVAGRFRVASLLGSGGMADVYRAVDAATGAPVALKIIRPVAGARGSEAEERVRREGEILKELAHPAIVRLETFGRAEDGRLFIAMDLLEGETLGDVMRRGRLSPAELAPIVAGTCAGLAAAHGKGIVHRDLKPDNIFLTQEGGALQVKLLDFGIAHLDDAAKKITKTGEILGTPRYMAPELLSAERDLDGRTDTYALGVILFEALAGRPPYLAANPTDLIVAILHAKHPPLGSLCRDLRADVEGVVARAMARAREARYSSAAELAQAYLSAVSAGSAAATAPRAGMGTAVLGSMGASGEGHEALDRSLELGTFSQLPQVTPGQVRGAASAAGGDVSKRAFAKTAPQSSSMTPVPDPGATRKKGSAGKSPQKPGRRSRAGGGPGETVALPDGSVGSDTASGYSGSDSNSFDDGTYQLPTNSGRMKLIVVGLLAGALSAGLAIAALSLLGSGDRGAAREADDSDDAREGRDGEEDRGAETAQEGQEGQEGQSDADDAGSSAMDGAPPIGVEAPEPPSPEEPAPEGAPGAAQPTRRGAGRRAAMAQPSEVSAPPRMGGGIGTAAQVDPGPASPVTPAPRLTAAELTRDARAALMDGDASRCADLAGQAVRAGGGPAVVRLRGDCLLGAGDRAGALAAYERFCRDAADHPSAPQVRSIVESMGGSCD